MGRRPSALFGVCIVLVAISVAVALKAETASIVVGSAKCLDCSRKDVKAQNAFKGLHVVVKCKASSGEYEPKTLGPLDDKGAFRIPLAADLLHNDGKLTHHCLAQLHGPSGSPCPGQAPSVLIPHSEAQGASTFVPAAGKLRFSSATCASATLLWKWDHFRKYFPFHKPCPPKSHFFVTPVYKPRTPPPVHKMPTPVHTLPTPVPVHKPPTPVYKPPTPMPVYKPPTPVHTPPTPVTVYRPPNLVHPPKTPVPVAPQPLYHPPPTPSIPPIHKKLPFVHKKPCPPLFPKLPPHHPLLKWLLKKKHHLYPPTMEDKKH